MRRTRSSAGIWTDASAVKLSVAAGAVRKSRCKDISESVPDSSAGEAVIVSLADGTATVKICNLTGSASPALSNLSLTVFAFG